MERKASLFTWRLDAKNSDASYKDEEDGSGPVLMKTEAASIDELSIQRQYFDARRAHQKINFFRYWQRFRSMEHDAAFIAMPTYHRRITLTSNHSRRRAVFQSFLSAKMQNFAASSTSSQDIPIRQKNSCVGNKVLKEKNVWAHWC
jgi:hypothetical protein